MINCCLLKELVNGMEKKLDLVWDCFFFMVRNVYRVFVWFRFFRCGDKNDS